MVSQVNEYQPIILPVKRALTEEIDQRLESFGQVPVIANQSSHITHQDLAIRSRNLAQVLLKFVDTDGQRIGICINGNIEQYLVCVLAVWRARQIAVPLNSQQPDALLANITKDSELSCLLVNGTSADLADRLQKRADPVLRSINIDDVDEGNGEIQMIPPDPDSIASITYTSGTTGTPKGCVHSHRHLMMAALDGRFPRLPSGSGVLLTLPYAFGASRPPLLSSLVHGLTLHWWDPRQGGSQSFLSFLDQTRPRVLYTSAGFARATLTQTNTYRESACPDWVLFRGGDNLTGRDIQRVRDHFGNDCRIVHGYGSSETGLIASYEVKHDEEFINSQVPVGVPPPELRIDLRPKENESEDNVQFGELIVRGQQLNLGYWKVPGSESDEEYKTGDIGRVDDQGRFYLSGRQDQMVKIRGFRVETGVIEACLLQIEDIHDAQVLAVPNSNGDHQLHAWIATHSEPDAAGLRKILVEELPSYSIPQYFHRVTEIPRNANGKADAGALMNLISGSDIDHSCWSANERLIASFWEQVLGRKVPRDVGFLAAGGSSLEAINVTSLIEARFGTQLSPAFLAGDPCISEVALAVEKAQSGDPDYRVIHLNQPSQKLGSLLCFHPMDGQVLCYQQIASHLPKLSIYGFEAAGLFNDVAPDETVGAMADRYVSVINKLELDLPVVLCGYSSGGIIAFAVAELMNALGMALPRIVFIDTDFSMRRWRSQIPLTKRMAWHCHRMLHSIRVGEALEYLQSQTGARRRGKVFRMQDKAMLPRHRREMLVRNYWDSVGSSGNQSDLRVRSILNLHQIAMKFYEPECLPAKGLFIRSQSQAGNVRRDIGWWRVVGKGLKVADLHYDHLNLISGDAAKAVAKLITEEFIGDLDVRGR